MLDEHLVYVSDRNRLEAFRRAISTVVEPGDVVADLGCGTAVLGLLSLKAGASRIVAVDSTAMLEVARETLTRAGFAERARFVRGNSHRVELSEQVDVVICDHVGFLGFDYGIVQMISDARRRFLKPGGRVVPKTIRLKLAAVQSDAARKKADGWAGADVPPELNWVSRYAVNSKHDVQLDANDLLSEPETLGAIDLMEDQADFLSWGATLRMSRDGVLHGIAGWFECELAPDVWMTNSPCEDRAINRPQAFLPIEEPTPVSAGEFVNARVMTRLTDNLLAWTVAVPGAGRQFRHSTWQGMLWAPQDIIRSRPDRVPLLSREGRARLTVLGCCDGLRNASEIERLVLEKYPDLLPSREETSRFVAQTLGWDTE